MLDMNSLVKNVNEAVNLLVTFDPMNYGEARAEVVKVLKEVGEDKPEFLYSGVRGLFQVKVGTNPRDVTGRLDALCRTDPSKFWYTYHWIPVEKWCSSTIREMSDVVKEFAERIKPNERWRMRINKRFYEKYHTDELIEKLTKHVDRPNVDLENPDKTIRIEIIGKEAALSLLEPKEHFSVNDVKDEVLAVKE
jgi:tRNA acetyltransferase TAN1